VNSNPVFKQHFKDYAKPMIIRSLFNSLMHTADKLIASMFIGASALVATTLISPLMFFMAALAMFFISGLAAYVGLLIGRDNVEKANHVSSGILVIMAVLGIAMTIPCVFLSKQLAYFLGARGEFFMLSVDYLRIFALSFPLLLVGRGLDILILNDGSPRFSFVLNILGAVTNLGLNLFAVAVLGWGIKGLAAATVVSSGIQFFGGLWYFLRRPKVLRLTVPTFHIPTILRIAYNGFSDFAMMIVEAVMVFIINIAFVKFLTPQHFEAYAAVSIIITLFYGIYMGASMGLQPILSQMMGRGEFHELTGILNYSVKKTMIYGVMIYLLLIPMIDEILLLFIKEPATIQVGQFFYLTLGLATLFSNYPLQMSIFFTAVNRPKESALISVFRTLIFIPPMVYLFIMQLGAAGVALGFIVTDILMILGLTLYMQKTDLSTLKVYE